MAVFKSSMQRKFFIDKKIREKSYPTATSLAKDYEVEFSKKIDPRTIASDIADMRQTYNAPIRYDAKNRGYFYSDKLYRLDILANDDESEFFTHLSQNNSQIANLPNWKKKVLVSLMNDTLSRVRQRGGKKHDFSEARVSVLPTTMASDSSQKIEKSCLEALSKSIPLQITLDKEHDSEIFTFYPIHLICDGENRLFFGKRYFENLRDIDFFLLNISDIESVDLLKADAEWQVSAYSVYVQTTGNDDIEIIMSKNTGEDNKEHIFIFGFDAYSSENKTDYYLLAHTELF